MGFGQSRAGETTQRERGDMPERGGGGGEQGHLSDLNSEESLAQDELGGTPAEAQHSSGM